MTEVSGWLRVEAMSDTIGHGLRIELPNGLSGHFFSVDGNVTGCLSDGTQWSGSADEFVYLCVLIREVVKTREDAAISEQRLRTFLAGDQG